jgi:hypothetical protein
VDVVLGVSMAPGTVRMVLVEGEGAGGVIVDQADFGVARDGAAGANQVIGAIVGTRESAAASGYRLRSSGVTWTDHTDAAALRQSLSERKIENVVLVSAFAAAAALAQAVGGATGCGRTALLFVEPAGATLAVVDTSDGSIAEVRRQPLSNDDDAALSQLAAMAATAESIRARPDGLFLVGSDVDIASLKPALEAATSLSVTAPEEPEMALARGAALASATAQLGAPSTFAIPPVEEPVRDLAYSAEGDNDSRYATERDGRRSRKVLAVLGVTSVFVAGAVALTLALALGIRPHVEQQPDISRNVVAPVTQAPPPQAQAPAPPPPPAAPAPQSAASPVPVAPNPAPSSNPPKQWLPLLPRDDDHDDPGAWLRRHLGRGILVP